jgi:hypothetical protein
MDDHGVETPTVPYGTHIWHLPSITTLKLTNAKQLQPLFRAPILLHYSQWESTITLLQLKELMLYSPLLQEMMFDTPRDADEKVDMNWKSTVGWLRDLIISQLINAINGDRRPSLYSSIWPSLTMFDALHELPLPLLQITVLPIVNQLRH